MIRQSRLVSHRLPGIKLLLISFAVIFGCNNNKENYIISQENGVRKVNSMETTMISPM